MTLILRKLLASSTFAIAGTLEALAYKLENELIRNNQQEEIKATISEDYETFEETDDEWRDENENGEESLDAGGQRGTGLNLGVSFFICL